VCSVLWGAVCSEKCVEGVHEWVDPLPPLVQCDVVKCSAVQCDVVKCSAVQCDVVKCSAVQCDVVKCSAAWFSICCGVQYVVRWTTRKQRRIYSKLSRVVCSVWVGCIRI
jgi:hypothetical protein